MSGRLSDGDRTVYRGIVDALLPATAAFPAASTVGVASERLDRMLEWRPDLVPDITRGLAAVRDRAPHEAIEWLIAHDVTAYEAIRLTALGSYYLDSGVRGALGYPGQESKPVPENETPDYLAPGLLDPVKARGPLWRQATTTSQLQETNKMARHVFLAFTNPAPGREQDFNDWQDHEHLPHGLKNQGFVKATRYKLADSQFGPAEGRAQYLTIWEIESDDIGSTLAKAGERNQTAVYTDALDFNSVQTVVYTALPKG